MTTMKTIVNNPSVVNLVLNLNSKPQYFLLQLFQCHF